MKFSTLACVGALVNAQGFGGGQTASWGSWTPWLGCSTTCGAGTRTRLRPCLSLTFNGCPGQSVQTGTCNEGPCPVWSDWSSWGDCSAKCDGGSQSRTRTCLNGNDGDCPGSATDDQQCNRQSCSRQMITWNYKISWGSWNYITAQYLNGDGPEACADYCLAYTGCNGIAVTIWKSTPSSTPLYYCYINYGAYTSGPNCWGTNCYDSSDMRHTIIFGVFRDYYESNPQNLPTDAPDGTIGTNYDEVEGMCDETSTGFGNVNYRYTKNIEFSSGDSKNVVRESGSNCAARCFEKAGCSAYYAIDNGCTFIIGQTSGGNENSNISDSGMISGLCPNTAFTSTFTRVSQFYCLFSTPASALNFADALVARNTGNADTPLRVWNFETRSNNPMITASQYVSVEVPNTSGNYARYRPVYFTVETHVRVGQSGNGNGRKRRADESELLPVGQFTVEDALRIAKQAEKDAKKAAKQRQIMPRTETIFAEIEEIEQQATSFILDGDMELPEDVEVAATGPIETVQFVQTAADGSVAADCSSGSCQCSAGFIDNGNGCEEMTEEQAATTQAPTTTQEPTDQVEDFLQSLVDKLQAVFEDNRPDKPRTHLLNKWEKLRTKSVKQYKKMKRNGCEYATTWSDDHVNFDTINTCPDIVSVAMSFNAWSREFTLDCNKIHKGREIEWHKRNNAKINQVWRRTAERLGCR